MIAIALRSVELDPSLLSGIYRITLFVFGIVLVILSAQYFVNILREKRLLTERILKLYHEWSENGIAITSWIKAHYQELQENLEATISNPELQGLLWKDVEIYNRLIILDPKLKEDLKANGIRDYFGSLIRTENQNPS